MRSLTQGQDKFEHALRACGVIKTNGRCIRVGNGKSISLVRSIQSCKINTLISKSLHFFIHLVYIEHSYSILSKYRYLQSKVKE